MLDIDGLDKQWEQGEPSIWSTEYNNDDGDEDDEEYNIEAGTATLPNAVIRLNNPVLERNYGIDEPHSQQQVQTPTVSPTAATESTEIDPPVESTRPLEIRNRTLVVRKLKLNEFRQSLVVHFSIAVQRNEV